MSQPEEKPCPYFALEPLRAEQLDEALTTLEQEGHQVLAIYAQRDSYARRRDISYKYRYTLWVQRKKEGANDA